MLDNRGSTVCTYIHTHVQPVFLAQMSYKYQETSTLILENTPYKENLRKAIKCGSSRGGGMQLQKPHLAVCQLHQSLHDNEHLVLVFPDKKELCIERVSLELQHQSVQELILCKSCPWGVAGE